MLLLLLTVLLESSNLFAIEGPQKKSRGRLRGSGDEPVRQVGEDRFATFWMMLVILMLVIARGAVRGGPTGAAGVIHRGLAGQRFGPLSHWSHLLMLMLLLPSASPVAPPAAASTTRFIVYVGHVLLEQRGRGRRGEEAVALLVVGRHELHQPHLSRREIK